MYQVHLKMQVAQHMVWEPGSSQVATLWLSFHCLIIMLISMIMIMIVIIIIMIISRISMIIMIMSLRF